MASSAREISPAFGSDHTDCRWLAQQRALAYAAVGFVRGWGAILGWLLAKAELALDAWE